MSTIQNSISVPVNPPIALILLQECFHGTANLLESTLIKE